MDVCLPASRLITKGGCRRIDVDNSTLEIESQVVEVPLEV